MLRLHHEKGKLNSPKDEAVSPQSKRPEHETTCVAPVEAADIQTLEGTSLFGEGLVVCWAPFSAHHVRGLI